MSTEEEFWDADGLPHRPYENDTDGVPYSAPTCGQDGEWWPCTTAAGRADE